MFGSAALEVMIGLVLLYFVLSVVVSAVNEFIASLSGLRAMTLRDGLRALLGDTDSKNGPDAHSLLTLLDGHPLVASLSKRRPPGSGATDGAGSAKTGTGPSYLSSRTFALALIDVIAPGSDDKVAQGVGSLRETIDKLPDSQTKKALLGISAEGHQTLEEFRDEVARWYDDTMDRATGWYKRRMQWCSLCVAALLVASLNADTIAMSKALWNEPEKRAALVVAAEQLVNDGAASAGSAESKKVQEAAAAALESASAELPLGWTSWHEAIEVILAGPNKVVGLFITIAAVSLGSGFWFDLLGKLISLRQSGAKPPRANEAYDKKPGAGQSAVAP